MPSLPSPLRRLAFGLALLFWALLLSAPPAYAQSDSAAFIQATDLFKIRQLGDVAVSPGGRSVAYTVTSTVAAADADAPDADGDHTYRTHLYLAPAGGQGAPRPLTRGPESATQPRWHPSGDRLAFVREVEGAPQVFLLSLLGGEPQQLTDLPYGATDPRFSPDGQQLLVASALPDSTVRRQTGEGPPWGERPGRPDTASDAAERAAPRPDGSLAQVRAFLSKESAAGRVRVTDRLDFQGERDLAPTPEYRHLFVLEVPAEDAAGAPDILSEPTQITNGFHSFGGGAWMPGSRQVVVSGYVEGDEHPDRERRSNLYLAAADGSGVNTLAAMDDYALSNPVVSPDGDIAFRAEALSDLGYAQSEIGLFVTDGRSEPKLLTLAFDHSAGPPQWSADGWYLYTVAASEGGFPLYRMAPFATDSAQTSPDSLASADTSRADTSDADTTGAPFLPYGSFNPPMDTALAGADSAAVSANTNTAPAIERLTSFARGVRSFDVSRATVFYVATEAANPYELYANTTEFTGERRLTRHNAAWLAGKQLSTPEPFTVQSDTLTIAGWTMRPPAFEEGRAYPLLVEMHGGPAAMWGPGEATMWHEFQYLAAQGYALVFSNPRGSGGYGHAFKAANFQDWGDGPMADVLAAADYAAALPWTDEAQQVLTGGSYAGYLTAWIVGHTDRFQAAVAQRGVYDLATFFGEGNAFRLVRGHFGGYPWEDAAGSPAADSEATGLPRGDAAALPTPLRPAALRPDSLQPDPPAFDAAFARAGGADSARNAPPAPLSPREALVYNSPITYVDQIDTPLLIMHADEDLRTGVSQSEMLYRSLKVLRKPVEYVRYPNAGHDLSRTGDPDQRLDRTLRLYEFFERYVEHPTL